MSEPSPFELCVMRDCDALGQSARCAECPQRAAALASKGQLPIPEFKPLNAHFPPQGVFSGTDGADAIGFALAMCETVTAWEAIDFLRGWNEGDTRDWPEFKPALAEDQKLSRFENALDWVVFCGLIILLLSVYMGIAVRGCH